AASRRAACFGVSSLIGAPDQVANGRLESLARQPLVETHHVATTATGETAPAAVLDVHAQAVVFVVMEWATPLHPATNVGFCWPFDVGGIVSAGIRQAFAPVSRQAV